MNNNVKLLRIYTLSVNVAAPAEEIASRVLQRPVAKVSALSAEELDRVLARLEVLTAK